MFLDLSQVAAEEKSLVNATEVSSNACTQLATEEEMRACLRVLGQGFIVMKNDILTRLAQVYELGNSVLTIAQQNLYTFQAGNRKFVSESSQVTRSLLTRCIQNM